MDCGSARWVAAGAERELAPMLELLCRVSQALALLLAARGSDRINAQSSDEHANKIAGSPCFVFSRFIAANISPSLPMSQFAQKLNRSIRLIVRIPAALVTRPKSRRAECGSQPGVIHGIRNVRNRPLNLSAPLTILRAKSKRLVHRKVPGERAWPFDAVFARIAILADRRSGKSSGVEKRTEPSRRRLRCLDRPADPRASNRWLLYREESDAVPPTIAVNGVPVCHVKVFISRQSPRSFNVQP